MSTRGCIAKPESDGWRGRYHHYDSYPSGLGLFLFKSYHGFFHGDVDEMIRTLIDDEPVGWSFIIGTDLSLGAEWREYRDYPEVPPGEAEWPGQKDYSAIGPQSYTAMGETYEGDGDWICSADGPDISIEWIYVLTPGGLLVVDGDHASATLVAWNDPDGEAKIVALEGGDDDS